MAMSAAARRLRYGRQLHHAAHSLRYCIESAALSWFPGAKGEPAENHGRLGWLRLAWAHARECERNLGHFFGEESR